MNHARRLVLSRNLSTDPQYSRRLKQAVQNHVSFAPVTSPEAQPASSTATVEQPPEKPSSPSKISSGLCGVIAAAQNQDSCLGMLADECDAERQLCVSLKKNHFESEHGRLVSLDSLLLNDYDFAKKQSLMLAVKLASSVLQLHATSWLGPCWERHDIMFLDQQEGDTDSRVERPLITKRMASMESPSSRGLSEAVLPDGIRNHSLVSLGIVLTEIWFGQTMERLREGSGVMETQQASNTKNLTTAMQLLDQIYRQAGDWYGDAVRRCLYCDFDQRNTSLEGNSMKDSVYRGVIVPLRDHLKALCGGQLDDTTL